MKKINKIMLIIVVFFLSVSIVKADYECFYSSKVESLTSFSSSETIEGSFKVLEDQSKIEISKKIVYFGNEYLPIGILDKDLNSQFTEEKLINNYLTDAEGKFCPNKVYVCTIDANASRERGYSILINTTLESNIKKGKYIGSHVYDGNCYVADIDKSKTKARIKKVIFACERYNNLKNLMEKNYCDVTKSSCNSSKLNLYNDYRDQLISYCKNLLNYADYGNDCVQSCLNIKNDIEALEGKTSNNFTCGLSDRLINWIKNILRWIKYILPVLVIILGIIDFIKAIASGSDDEMKKAQGRFIKRLIAAALFFLAPVLIEFILNIFKIGDNPFCGIID